MLKSITNFLFSYNFPKIMELSSSGIPIVDLSFSEPSQVAQHVSKACKDAGCFYIRNHGVDLQLIENTFHDLRTFFEQPIDYKMKFLDPNQNVDRGYQQFETQNVNAFMGRLGLPNDPVEKFSFGPPPGRVFIYDIPSTNQPFKNQ
jgi:hypothetical protein